MSTGTEPISALPPPGPPKRKYSTNDGEERIIKHRASKACQSCRTRKVRCDVSAKGSRCTNCELDQLECVVLPSRRGQSNRIYRRNTTAPTQSFSVSPVQGRRGSDLRSPTYPRPLKAKQPALSPVQQNRVPAVVTFDDDGDNETDEQEPETAASAFDHPSGDTYETLLTPDTAINAVVQHQSPSSSTPLPAFIAPLPGRILPEDLDFLKRKGAFAVPETGLCVEILRAYLFSVHPFMPMLDVGPFSRALLAEDGQISLLLFQAVMFAGLHSLQPVVVQRLGFQSPKQAREIFFNRARLLYDFNIESDNAAILQSLILMSSWYSKQSPWNERRHTWHWTGLAYDLARTMGLHREPSDRHASEQVRRFRRRLWWSLYIRDRMIALGTRRPMRIPDSDFDVDMLTLDDFDLEPPKIDGEASALTPSHEESTRTALMCIQLVRLSVCIGRVVPSQYTTLGTGASHSMLMMPKRDSSGAAQLQSCERELQEWIEALPGNIRRPGFSPTHGDHRTCSEVHWAQLNMTYLTVVNVLHRAQALQLPAESHSSGDSSRSKVKEAARSITRLAQDMLRLDQVRYLGLIGVTALLAASLTHMLDLGAAHEDVRDASAFRLHQTLQVLESLREIYASADSAVSFLASVTKKAGIYLPLQPQSATTGVVSASAAGMDKRATHESSKSASTYLPKLSNERTGEQWDARWSVNSFRASSRTSGNPSHPRAQSIGNDRSILASDPSQTAFQGGIVGASTYSNDAARRLSHPQGGNPGMDTTFSQTMLFSQDSNAETGLTNLAPDHNGLNWSSGLDSTLDLGPMSFNYDFFSDAFGFLDGDAQYM